MVQAIWNNAVLADSDDTVIVEGNHYFPLEAIKLELFKPSAMTSVCPWKGIAHYYSIVVDGVENRDAAWHYPCPSPAAANIQGRVAFWKGVKVS